MFWNLFRKRAKKQTQRENTAKLPQIDQTVKPVKIFNQTFGELTIQSVRSQKKGIYLEASYRDSAKITMEYCESDLAELPEGNNAYFVGNKLVIVTRWDGLSEREVLTVRSADLVLALHLYECVQLSLKVGENWGDVMVNLPHCYAGLNDENAPVDEVIFLFMDMMDPKFVVCRSVRLPEFVQKLLQKCNVSSHKLLNLDGQVPQLQIIAAQDPTRDFCDYLYDLCWEKTRKFYKKAADTEDLDDILDGLYIEIDGSNKVTNLYQNA